MEKTLHNSIDVALHCFYSKNLEEPFAILMNVNNFNKLTDYYSKMIAGYSINKVEKTSIKNAKYCGIRILICNDLKDDEIQIAL
jgi:hypothetical protein